MTTPSSTDVPSNGFGGFGRPASPDYRPSAYRPETPVTVAEAAPVAGDEIQFNSFLSSASDGRRRRRGHARAATAAATTGGAVYASDAPAYVERERVVRTGRPSNRTALIAGVGLLALAGVATGAIWAMSNRTAEPVTNQAAVDQIAPLNAPGAAESAGAAATTAAAEALTVTPVVTPTPVARVAPTPVVRTTPVRRAAPAATRRAAPPVAVIPEGTTATPVVSAPPSRQPEPIVITPPAEPVVTTPTPTETPDPQVTPQG